MVHDLLDFTSQGRVRIHKAISISSIRHMIRANLLYIPLGMTVTINYHLIHYKRNVPFMFIKPWFLKKRKSSFFMSRLPRLFLDGPHFSSKWELLFGTEPIQKSIAIKCQMEENTLYHQSTQLTQISF